MNVSTRVGSILGAAAAALALCAGPAAASGQSAAPTAPGSALPAHTAATDATPGAAAPRLNRSFTLTSPNPQAFTKCLDVYDWGNGPWIQVWDCHGGANQSWNITWNSTSGGWNIQSNSSLHYCVDGSRGHGEQLIQNVCGDGLGQAWKIDSFSGASHYESVAFPGQCMDIYNWGRGPVVQLWDCGSQTNQYWQYN